MNFYNGLFYRESGEGHYWNGDQYGHELELAGEDTQGKVFLLFF